MNNTVYIFTDGACRGNPGPGGWGAILRYKDAEKEYFGGEQETTNNRMEMTAVIEALATLKRECKVDLSTDSRYVIDGITKWIIGWKKKNWKNSKNQAVKNEDLWKAMDKLVQQHNITWNWVKGHSGHIENERADALANKGIDTL
ncbi:MAG: ribonuclease HI [Pseudomonadota bacterium]